MAENSGIEHRVRSLPSIGTPAVVQGSVVRHLRRFDRLRLDNDDGTPTMWCAFIGIIAPAVVVLSIVAVALVRQ
ncbi:MAG: hypothetical protein ACXVE1_09420 [Gaiellaceae bacterium]